MAIKRDTRYPGRWTPANADFPLGGPKNRTTSTSKDGSYFERDFMADYEAFFQRLMTEAGITASELPDTALTSQFYNALVNNMRLSNPSQGWSPDVNYDIGQEVVRNGLRYIARAASGPDNGGEQQPDPSIVEYWFEIPSVGTRAFEFLSVPIGSPIPISGALPPTNDPRFRYVVLTDADPYNNGVLINKQVSGTAPNLVIKYTINMPGSPLNGTEIEMLNTMEAVISPSLTNGKVFNDTIRNIEASVFTVFGQRSGAFSAQPQGTGIQISGSANFYGDLKFNASSVVPTGPRNQTFAIGAKYLMRIK